MRGRGGSLQHLILTLCRELGAGGGLRGGGLQHLILTLCRGGGGRGLTAFNSDVVSWGGGT